MDYGFWTAGQFICRAHRVSFEHDRKGVIGTIKQSVNSKPFLYTLVCAGNCERAFTGIAWACAISFGLRSLLSLFIIYRAGFLV